MKKRNRNIAKVLNDLIAEVTGTSLISIQDIRFMRDEELYSEESIQDTINRNDMSVIKHLVMSKWSYNPKRFLGLFPELFKKYIDYDRFKKTGKGIIWENIHGKKRRVAKYETKKFHKSIRNQYETYNKYVGRDDVLYFHTILNNEQYNKLCSSSSYIEDVADWFDPRYRDMYFKADPDVLSDLLNDKEFMEIFDSLYRSVSCICYY